MAHIYNSIMSLIKPARVASAATTLSENEHKIGAGVDLVLPSLLAMLLKVGDTPEIEAVLKEGKRIKAWENIDRIWQGSGVDEHVNLGERMENRLLGSYNPRFNTAVGHKATLRAGDTDRLTNWVAGTVAAWLSQQVAGGTSLKALLSDLATEKEVLRKAVPADIAHDLGLAHTLGIHSEGHKPAAPKHAAPVAAHAAAPKKDPVMVHTPEPAKSMAWLWWLLGLIALALVIMWVARSCGARKMAAVAPVAAVEKVAADAKAAVQTTAAEVKATAAAAPKFSGVARVLPDGTKITVYQGHLEEAVKAYLDSDKFKSATDAELRSVWFEFTDIDFEHNKSTELMTGSPERLMVLVNTLKNYPDVKIKVGSFGDRTGTRAANYEISEKRALTIMETLKASGFPAANLSHEGFGKEYAQASATAPDSERAPDRDVAMRFTR